MGIKTWNGKDAEYCATVAAIAQGPDTRGAQRAVHDFLVESTGDLRCGPVHWKVFTAHEAPRAVADLIHGGFAETPEELESYAKVLDYLKHHPNGRLVLGMVPTTARPEGVA